MTANCRFKGAGNVPNRIIKESIRTSETIAGLTDFQENFFYRLTVTVDDYGRFDARPAILKASLYPLRERLTLRDVEGALKALLDAGCVEVYTVDDRPYLHLATWEVHQRVRNKRSKYPEAGNDNTPSLDSNPPPNAPVIQSESRIQNPNPESESKRAAADYLDRVNPSASAQSLEELSAYEKSLGTPACIRAIDIALDEKKAAWSYIRGILRRWTAAGVKCLADIDALDASHDSRKGEGASGRASFADVLEKMKREGRA